MNFPNTEEVEKRLLPLLFCTNHGTKWEYCPYKEDGSEVGCVNYFLPDGRAIEIDASGRVSVLKPDANNPESAIILFSWGEGYPTAKKIYNAVIESLNKEDCIELAALREACIEFMKEEELKMREKNQDEPQH